MHEGSSNGSSHPLGQRSGEENHLLSAQEMPNHTHSLNSTNQEATHDTFSNNVSARTQQGTYAKFTRGVNMNTQVIANVGSGQSHNNMQPFVGINYIICLQGDPPPFPST